MRFIANRIRPAHEGKSAKMKMGPSQLLAALSYLTDVTPSGCRYHSWRVALVSQHLASIIAPSIQRDIFYAGLLHDAGAVGAPKHITQYVTQHEQLDDPKVRSHPSRSAALVSWLPSMGAAAQYARCHHEWWNGAGYPEGMSGDMIPMGSQILGIVGAAELAGCFRSRSSLRSCLPALSNLTGFAWSQDMWAAFVRSTGDAAFYKLVTDPSALPELMAQKTSELKVPEDLDNEEGVERVLHLFAVLVDMKDPSTTGHSLRTARRAGALARYVELEEDEIRLAFRAGLVHDCGRLGIDTTVLNKSSRLSAEEMKMVRKHAQMTIDVMNCFPDCPEMAEIGHVAGHDHERFDGAGYPDNLAGDNIPPVSRLLSVVDAYDSMISSANYRLLTPKGAVVRIEQAAGTQFDPEVVEAMVEAVNSGALEEDSKRAA